MTAPNRSFGNPETIEPGRYYRLYRFLTELEDILDIFHDDISRLEAITPLVRKLLVSSYWLQMEYNTPDPITGWSVNFLYREHQFSITVQMVAWLPGHTSSIHNHGAWGIGVGVMSYAPPLTPYPSNFLPNGMKDLAS